MPRPRATWRRAARLRAVRCQRRRIVCHQSQGRCAEGGTLPADEIRDKLAQSTRNSSADTILRKWSPPIGRHRNRQRGAQGRRHSLAARGIRDEDATRARRSAFAPSSMMRQSTTTGSFWPRSCGSRAMRGCYRARRARECLQAAECEGARSPTTSRFCASSMMCCRARSKGSASFSAVRPSFCSIHDAGSTATRRFSPALPRTVSPRGGLVDTSGPVIRLQSLTPEDLYVLLGNVRHVFAAGDPAKHLVPDEALEQFMHHCEKKIGEAYFRTPRTTIKQFVELLNVRRAKSGHRLAGPHR